jgi:hypothetical protein
METKRDEVDVAAGRGARAAVMLIVAALAAAVAADRGAWCVLAWAATLGALFAAMLAVAVHDIAKGLGR